MTKYIPFSLLTIALMSIGSIVGKGQAANDDLSQKRISIHASAKSFRTVMAQLMFRYDVAVGFEQSTLDNNPSMIYYDLATNLPLNPKYFADKEIPTDHGDIPVDHLITVDFENARLKDVMDSIVGQMKNYDWVIEDDVVNIFPTKGRDPRLKDLLDRKVDKFQFAKNQPMEWLQPQIMVHLPMARKFLDEYKLGTDSPGLKLAADGSWGAEKRTLATDIIITNVTFRQLLNQIAKAKRGGWLLRLLASRRLTPEIEYLELSI